MIATKTSIWLLVLSPVSSMPTYLSAQTPGLESALTHGGLSFQTKESIPPSATRLRVLVRASGSDALGSVTLQLREILED